MAKTTEVSLERHFGLDDYAKSVAIRPSVDALRRAAEDLGELRGRTVWMVSSTARGGGVAETLPGLGGILRELGVDVRWLVIEPEVHGFFPLTKRIHNLVHGADCPAPEEDDRALYRDVSSALADDLAERITAQDILVVHDPQPLGCGAICAERVGVPAVWRCHIGLDGENAATRAAWEFLESWLDPYARLVFSIDRYVPPGLDDRPVSIIPPGIDPLSHKNRRLTIHKLTGILAAAGLGRSPVPALHPPFAHRARRVQDDGGVDEATSPDDLGLLYRPAVVQVSRWDRLKGWDVLLDGFARLRARSRPPGIHARRVAQTRLVLAGPDPGGVADDPEAQGVLDELVDHWRGLPEPVRSDVALLLLPMRRAKHNALMVNVLQRCAAVVAQMSRREGFGLTVAEGMWKGAPILGSSAAGIRAQVDDGVHGRLVGDAEDPAEVADVLDEMLASPKALDLYAENARRRVADEHLVLTQARRWLELLARL